MILYSKDVAPILQKNCEGCHRAGEAAPMSFGNYKQVRPYAAAIKEAVLLKKMPPWFADARYGHFSNDRRMAEQDIKTLVAWADTGAKEGDPKDLPRPVEYLNGWNISKPDSEIEMAQGLLQSRPAAPSITSTSWSKAISKKIPGSPRLKFVPATALWFTT